MFLPACVRACASLWYLCKGFKFLAILFLLDVFVVQVYRAGGGNAERTVLVFIVLGTVIIYILLELILLDVLHLDQTSPSVCFPLFCPYAGFSLLVAGGLFSSAGVFHISSRLIPISTLY